MKRILRSLNIIQEVSNKERSPKLGRGYLKAYRFNPYNPLSYLALVLTLIITLIGFGVIGLWESINKNPFKWD